MLNSFQMLLTSLLHLRTKGSFLCGDLSLSLWRLVTSFSCSVCIFLSRIVSDIPIFFKVAYDYGLLSKPPKPHYSQIARWLGWAIWPVWPGWPGWLVWPLHVKSNVACFTCLMVSITCTHWVAEADIKNCTIRDIVAFLRRKPVRGSSSNGTLWHSILAGADMK